MSSVQKHPLNKFVSIITLVSMILSLVLPILPAAAQETTETPETPTEVVIETQNVPEVTQEATEVNQPEVTQEPTLAPTATATPLDSLFTEDFQDGSTDGWLLTEGSQVVVEGQNSFLRLGLATTTATIQNVNWEHLLFAANVRVPVDNTLSVAVNAGVENYTVTLDAAGKPTLSRTDAVLAEGAPVTIDATATPELYPWRKLNIKILGGNIVVAVNGVVQVDYTDPAPLGAGAVVFSTGAANTGAVDVDDITLNKLELPVVTPTETATEAAPEVTPEATTEATAEVTEEVPAGVLILSADFEGDNAGWLLGVGASVVAESDTNKALLLAPTSTLSPADTLLFADFDIDARFNIVTDAQDGTASGVTVTFRSLDGQTYALSVEAGQTVLNRVDANGTTALATSATAHGLNAWHTLNLQTRGGNIAVTVDDVEEINYTDAMPLSYGEFGFAANNASSVMLDDIAVTDYTDPDTIVATSATPMPLGITAENQLKLDGTLYSILELYVNGDVEGALQRADELNIPLLDEALRISVIVWGNEGFSGDTLVPTVEAAGGIVQEIKETSVKADVPLLGLVALMNTEAVFAIWLQPTIAANGEAAAGDLSPLGDPAGGTYSEGFDMIGADPWHNAGITGASGASIAVLDTGFNGVAALAAGERSCLTGTNPTGGFGVGNHGTNVIQVLCDIVPAAGTVSMYTVANDGSDLASQIAVASASNKIILIALDLGAHAAPGDGTGGGISEDFQIVYDNIATARLNGKIVIASAGNNEGRYESFNYTGTSRTVIFTASVGDKVNVSWNSWGGTTFPTLSLSGSGSYNNRPGGASPSFQFTVGQANPTLTVSGAGNFYIQVQVVGNNAAITGGSAPFDVNAGNIGRPADSPNVIAVGAVCANRLGNYPIHPNSAHGPVFGSGGAAPLAPVLPLVRNEVKPDVVAPSQVSTTLAFVGDPAACNEGFGGTSAAAAHVAGMAALLVANNSAGMSIFDGSTADAADAVKDYLQSHAADFPLGGGLAGANGFDMTYGAGLTVLGDPNFDLTTVTNFQDLPDNVDTDQCLGGYSFVGQANPGDPLMDGTQANPYLHPAYALNIAPANSCVIVMPGEYSTPIYIDDTTNDNVTLMSFDSAMFADMPDSVFYTHNMYIDPAFVGEAAIYVRQNNNDVTFDGFTFTPSSIYDTSIFLPPQIFLVDGNGAGGTNTVTFRNNSVVNFDNGRLIQVLNGAQDVHIERNTFMDNDGPTFLPAVIEIKDSGDTTPIIVELNLFQNNTAKAFGSINDWQSLINVLDSGAHIRSNVFNSNQVETVIHSNTTTNRELRILGNVFIKNILTSIEPSSNSGPIINLVNTPRFMFVNNTVANNTLNVAGYGTTYGAIIGRGNNSGSGGGGFYEIHNNIIYNNIEARTFVEDFVGPTGCNDYADGSNDPNVGAKKNWIWNDPQFGTLSLGECGLSINNAANENITDVDPIDYFIGALPNSIVTDTNPIYYALIPPTNVAPAPDTNPDNGIEDGLDAFYTTYLNDNNTTVKLPTDFDFDAAGKARRTDGDGNLTPLIDIGAYELVVLRIINPNLPAGPYAEDTGPHNINLASNVEGGYGNLTFTITQNPLRFGNQCSPLFSATSGALIIGGDTASYCPPQDFYTLSGEIPNIVPDNVTFTYRVQDEVGAFDTGSINLTITPVNDTPLSNAIGDGVPATDIFEVVANANTLIQLRLRPFVRFGSIASPLSGNMVFSERNNEIEPALKTQVDYRYVYSGLTLAITNNPGLFPPAIPAVAGCTIANAPCVDASTGVMVLNFANDSRKGTAEYTYTVTDKNGTGTSSTGNRVKIRVVSIIPNRGLHDDTSIVWDYSENWTALYSEKNINNTLHDSVKANDFAEVKFVGSGFVLYMQGANGGQWQLTIDSVPVGNWVPGAITGEFTTTVGAATCVTRQKTITTRVLNTGTAPYSISCSGLNAGSVHTVRITNAEAKKLQLDAIAIMNDTVGPALTLGPGFHTVDELAMRELFASKPEWVELIDAKANGGRARVTTTEIGADFTFKIEGSTGFAIGTMLENKVKPVPTDTNGAQYQICVQEDGQPTTRVCQNFDNGLGASASALWKVFRPFYGLDPNKVYDVSVDVTSVQSGERMAIDSIVLFDDTVTGPLNPGTTEDDARDYFVFGSALQDTWLYDTNMTAASNRSLTTIANNVLAAGPFVSFQIPNDVDTIIWNRVGSATQDSTNTLICVDRAIGVGSTNNAGNCIKVNLRTGVYQKQLMDGSFDIEQPTIQPQLGALVITESLFRANWSGTGHHTVEIFSLVNEKFSFDKVLVLNSLDTAPLPAGNYEEFTSSIEYFDNDAGHTLGASSFVSIGDAKASGTKVMGTNQVGEGVFFHFHGTGFTVRFTIDTKADAIRICWLQGDKSANTVNDVLDTGTCQTYDNESKASISQAGRTILGLHEDDYTVAVQLLDDNLIPLPHVANTLPISLKFDTVEIYDDPWFTPGDWNNVGNLGVLTPGTRYETSFVNRVTDNRFRYYGTGWKSVSGNSANKYSGLNYDEVRNFGAGVLFRTYGGDALILYRDTQANYTPLEVCATPMDGTNNTVDLTQRYCTTVLNNAGTGNQQPFGFLFNTTGDNTEYVVSITTLDQNTLRLDAIELVDSDTFDGINGTDRVLGAGLYEEFNPALVYDRSYTNALVNGDMERNADWTNVGAVVSTQSSTQKFTNKFSRSVPAAGADQGIQSTPITLVNGQRYTIIARVFVVSGVVKMTNPSASFTVETTAPLGKWQTLRHDFVASPTPLSLQFLSSGGASNFFVDDVTVNTGGSWAPIFNNSYSDKRMMESRTHGAQMTFSFFGTGFEIGTLLDKSGGEVEICYVSGATTNFSGAECFIYENEFAGTSALTSRTVAGLANATYSVRVRDVEDGRTVLTKVATDNRLALNGVNKLRIDYVRIFGAMTQTTVPAGLYNENAVDGNGNAYLQFLPGDRWNNFADATAKNFSNQSYTTIIGPTGTRSTTYAGPVGVLRVSQNATVILYTDKAVTTNSDQLLVCADAVNGAIEWNGTTATLVGSSNCVLLDAFKLSPQVVVNPGILPRLGTAGTHVLTFRSLKPTGINIDHFQVFYGSTLGAGFYEDIIGNGPTSVLQTLSGTWTTVKNTSFSGGSALQSTSPGASIRFQFTGTGFSLMTLFEKAATTPTTFGGADLQIQIDGAGSNDFNDVVSTVNAASIYGGSITFSGLPLDTYTVTITKPASPNGSKVVIDALQIYGALQQLGSLYDDEELSAAGLPLLTFGPDSKAWTVNTGTKAVGFLNQTNHYTKAFGSSVSFNIGAANGIVLYTGTKSKATVEVCWIRTQPLAVGQTCSPLVNTTGLDRHTIANPLSGGTQYAVSIKSVSHNLDFYVDAVQVLEVGPFVEGIYNRAYLTTNGNFSGTWTDSGTLLKSGISGAALEFEFTGIGFSIILSETGASSATYELCVDTGTGGTAGSTNCNTVGASATTPQVLTKIANANKPLAITYVGLHNNSGNNQTFSVRLRNNDPTKPLLVERVEVLGADNTLQIDDFERHENDDPKIQYFPFGSLLESNVVNNGPSGGTQHIGSLRGSVIYFEFRGNSTEYFRQISTAHGNVEICYGRVDNNVGTPNGCLPVQSNSGGNIFQSGLSINTTALNCTDAEGCWVSIKNLNDKPMPLDFIQLLDPSQPLAAGFYEAETHPALRFFDNDAPTYTLGASSFTALVDTAASGGKVMTSAQIGEGMLFSFNGTGFSVLFKQEAKADVVKICWVAGETTDVADVLDGTCQIFDNFSTAVLNKTSRTILGLHEGDYTVAVQFLDDNFTPKTHIASQLPLAIKIDAVQVYNDPWFTPGNWNDTSNLAVLTPGTRYETSYNNRETNNRFLYYGATWKSVTGGGANRQSGQNYDEVKTAGAGIVFRTNGADALLLYRDTKAGSAPLFVCVTPMNGANTQVDLANRYCTLVTNDTGNGNQQPAGILFNTTGNNTEHVVSVVTLTNGSFILDAIELVNTDTYDSVANGTTYRILGPGFYEDFVPALVYDRSVDNLILNGDMERNLPTDWVNITGNAPTTNVQFATRFTNSFSRRVVGSANGRGIQSNDFEVVAGQTYTVIARVQRVTGVVAMTTSTGAFTVLSDQTPTLVKKWQTLRVTFTAAATQTMNLRFIASGGPAEFYVDDVSMYHGALWVPIFNTAYSNGRMMESRNPGAQMTFTFTGTGFEIGTLLDKDGGEVEICYIAGATTNFTGAKCFVYQNEFKSTNSTTSRTVAGLASGTYSVRIRDLEDGRTVLTKIPTDSRNLNSVNGKVRVDYVQIFGDAAPTTAPSDFLSDVAVDNNGNRFLQLLPANRWGNIFGTSAKSYTNMSYMAVIDPMTGKAVNKYAGPVALLNVNVPTAEGISVVIYTGPVSASNANQLLACVDNVSGTLTWNGTAFTLTNTTDCTLITSLLTTSQFILSPDLLPSLGVAGPHIVTIRALTPGLLNIDNYQIIAGTTLTPGVYDEFLPDNLLNFTPNINPDPKACNPLTQWCYFKNAKALGGSVARIRQDQATLTFSIEGTGFSILSDVNPTGVDMRICYKLASSGEPFPAPGDELPEPDVANNEVWCQKVTTNTTSWATFNVDRLKPAGTASQYGFAYYGLPNGQYSVEVRIDDASMAASHYLQIDGVVVFGDVATPDRLITTGLYDDAQANILYDPDVFWTTRTYTTGPTKGAWGLSEHLTTNAGSTAQLYMEGNALTLYQTVTTTGSKDIRICVIITDTVIHCSELGEERRANESTFFSQNGKTTYFTPIVFYGLGDGAHRVIIENRDHTRALSIDAIRVWE